MKSTGPAFTSWSTPGGSSDGGTLLNQVDDSYNGLSHVITEYLAHAGAGNVGTTAKAARAPRMAGSWPINKWHRRLAQNCPKEPNAAEHWNDASIKYKNDAAKAVTDTR
jgi:hypothetical protein